MADKKAGGLYLSIGLTLSQLQSDFLAAEQTVKQGISALNRQQNLIKLRMEADTAGLDRAKDAAKILEIQEQSLTQVLQMQRDKLTLATKAYQDVAQSKGANSAAAKQLETSMERERLAVARLEAQLKSLSEQKIAINSTKLQTQLQDNISKLNAKVQHVKIQAELDTSKFKSAGNVFDAQKIQIAAVTKEIELQRQKLAQLQAQMYQSARQSGADSSTTLNIKSNVLQQLREIQQLEAKLKELQSTNINVQIRNDSIKRVEAEISENIARINAKIEHIKVKTDIDVSKLGTAASEFDRAKAHVQGLNRELDLQNQKLAEMRRALGNSISANGLNNVKTINLQIEIQKQIQAINQLKAKIQELNNIAPPKTNNLLSNYLNIKGDVTGALNNITTAFSNLQGATSSADNAIVASLSVIGSIPHPVGRAVAAFAAMPVVLKGVENSLVDMARAATAAGDATYVMSRGFQMSVKDAGKFSTNAKVAGTDVNSLATAVKNVQRQIVKGGDDSRAAEWLKRYGESARDANGNLKNLNELTFSLSRALHKAQEEGKGAEFVFSVFRNISADDITAIEDWIAVNEQAATIVKNGLANPALAHEVKGNLNALAVQEGQLKASFESALLPVANEIIPRLTERAGKLTQILADNKDVIKEIGNDLASIWGGVETVVDKIGGGISAVGGVFKDIYMARVKAEERLIERYKNDASIQTAEDLFQRELPRNYTWQERQTIENDSYRYEQELKRYEPLIKAIRDAREKIQEEKKSLAATMAEGIAGNILKPFVDSINQDITPNLQKYRDEVDAILYKLNHTDYENKIYDVEKRYEAALRDGEKTLLEQVELQKLKQAQLAQIQKEQLEKTKQYYRDAADIEYSLTHSAYEKQLRDIELWKDAKIKAGEDAAAVIANAAAKEAEAFEREVDRIKGATQSLEDEIFEMENSQYEADKRRAFQKAQRALESGVDIDTVQRFLNDKLRQLNQRAQQGGDYTKAPEGAMQRGGNGISVIGADQIIDDGKLNQSIGLVADVSREFAQLSSTLSDETRERIAAIESTKQLADAQNNLAQQTSGLQIIEGDQFVNQPSAQQSLPTIDSNPADSLKNFATSTQEISNAQKAFADSVKNFPPDYFNNLADSSKAVSDMQLALTNSTMRLIDAQDKLATAISNLPSTENATRNTATNQPTDGMLQLATATQDVRHEQTLLAQSARDANENLRAISDIPRQAPTVQRDEGWKFGVDYDTFKDVLLTGVGLAVPAAMTGAGAAAVPAIAVGTLAAAIAAAIGKGSYDETHAAHDVTDDRLKPFAEIDMSQLATPLVNIDGNVKSILDALSPTEQAGAKSLSPELFTPLANIDTPLSNLIQQFIDAQSDEGLQELLGTLPNIEAGVADILAAIQLRTEELPDTSTQLPNAQDLQERTSTHLPESAITDYSAPLATIDGRLQSLIQAVQTKEIIVPFETVVTPIDNLAKLVGNILTALNNRQPPQINVAPNNNIDLGGAYVFDNALKSELVTDITTNIVDEITSAVRQAIGGSGYNYGA